MTHSATSLDRCLRQHSTVLDRHTSPFRGVSSLSVQSVSNPRKLHGRGPLLICFGTDVTFRAFGAGLRVYR